MKKAILITGVSCAGKSTIAKRREEMGYTSYNIEVLPGLFSTIDKVTKRPFKHDNTDLEKIKNSEWICDKEKLQKIIVNQVADIAFYCGTASNIMDLTDLFDAVFVLKASPETTRERLTTRTTHDFGKTTEVQDWVMSWKDWWEDEIQKKDVVMVNANRSLDEVVGDILEKVQHSPIRL